MIPGTALTVLLIFEKLDFAFMLPGGREGSKSAEIPPPARLRIFLPGVKPVTVFDFADHLPVPPDGACLPAEFGRDTF